MYFSDAQRSRDAIAQHGRRNRCLKSARLLFNLGRSSLDVVITEYSEKGARIRMSVPMPCPVRFDLEVLNPAPGMFSSKRCELRWQHGMTLGVLFV
jgi:hypothetical protein